jgi:APA family basic amino acid/polyamine antiporter
LIGTTLTCLNTGARVTYAMGRDRELPENFGLLHQKNLTPHRAIWALAGISAIVGCVAVAVVFGDSSAPTDAVIQALPHGFWSSFGYTTHDKMAALPNTLLLVTLTSNFGTFMLYGLSCITCFFAYQDHPNHSFLRHVFVPAFGVVANLACMMFYLVGPFLGYGTKIEPWGALIIAILWGIYGGIYFMRKSKSEGRTVIIQGRAAIVQSEF